ncbi:MAG: iron transporter [Bacteroidetes bacterium RIFCSPLOWO2_12_FULL_35_15]|nr:MAG: iron transporter [Bacteroidetes bacterium RIFCSPLOWO2_12_FULL_35_15]
MKPSKKKTNKLKHFWKSFGPGLITGASDDDPSGIATYSQAGAKYGFQLLWTALFTYPLMVAIQEMCARIGIVTKKGLTGIIKKHYPKYILFTIISISIPSIILNIGADIAGMGAVGNLLIPKIPASVFSIVFTILLIYSIIFWSYKKIASILKWLCISLFSYMIIPFLIKTDWALVFKNTFVPTIIKDKDFFMVLVGIFGTTISPYLFFWQTSMEVEDKKERKLVVDKKIISEMESDITVGMFLSNLAFFFIVLTTGSVLFNANIHNITTVEEAAKALKPLAGDFSYLLFSVGVIGTGFLAIPVLASSISYMMAETFGWKEGLNKKFKQAPGFYITMIISLGIGLLIPILGISPIKALLYTAVLYGITAPLLIGIILHICNQKKIMGEFTNGKWANTFGIITFIIMITSALFLMYYTLFT